MGRFDLVYSSWHETACCAEGNLHTREGDVTPTGSHVV
jgi:hypothetical protein